MSNHLAIATVTATLKRMIEEAFSSTLRGTNIDAGVTTRPPGVTEDQQTNSLNIFLYQVTINNGYGNFDLPTRSPNGGELAGRPLLGLNLYYLLTAYAANDNDLIAHIILAAAMRVLHEKPVLTREIIHDTLLPKEGEGPPEIKGSDLEGQVELVKITHQPLSLEELTKLWSSFFQARYHVSVAYQATVVLLESEREPKRVLPVTDRRIYVLQFRHPVIERVEPQILEEKPDAKITLTGRNLKADNVSVHFGRIAAVPRPEDVRDDQILIAIPRNLTAGISSIQVVHPLLLGSPEVEHKGFLSNLIPFVLAPRITKVNFSPLIPNAPAMEIAHDGPVSVEFEPAVTSRQKVALLMGDLTIPVSGQDLRINAVFTWQNVPGSDSNNLKEFLRNNFSVDWIANQQQPFTKIDEKTIIASSIDNQHSLSVRLDYEPRRATSATLTIDKKEIYEFLANVSDSRTILYHGNRLLIDPTSDLYKEILPTRSFPLGTHFFGIQVDGVQSLPLVDTEPQSPTYRQILGPRIKVI